MPRAAQSELGRRQIASRAKRVRIGAECVLLRAERASLRLECIRIRAAGVVRRSQHVLLGLGQNALRPVGNGLRPKRGRSSPTQNPSRPRCNRLESKRSLLWWQQNRPRPRWILPWLEHQRASAKRILHRAKHNRSRPKQNLIRPKQILIRPKQMLLWPKHILFRSKQILRCAKQNLLSANVVLLWPKQILLWLDLILLRSKQNVLRPNAILLRSNCILLRPNAILFRSNVIRASAECHSASAECDSASSSGPFVDASANPGGASVIFTRVVAAARKACGRSAVEIARFRGTCHRASNWIEVGQTQGCSRLRLGDVAQGRPKAVFVFSLRRQPPSCKIRGTDCSSNRWPDRRPASRPSWPECRTGRSGSTRRDSSCRKSRRGRRRSSWSDRTAGRRSSPTGWWRSNQAPHSWRSPSDQSIPPRRCSSTDRWPSRRRSTYRTLRHPRWAGGGRGLHHHSRRRSRRSRFHHRCSDRDRGSRKTARSRWCRRVRRSGTGCRSCRARGSGCRHQTRSGTRRSSRGSYNRRSSCTCRTR